MVRPVAHVAVSVCGAGEDELWMSVPAVSIAGNSGSACTN